MSRELPEGWKLTVFGDIAWGVSARNRSRDEIPVLSVTKYDGFVPSQEYFKKKVFSADTENYKIVRKGQFAYATIHLDEGSIDRLTRFDVGLISPMYTVFEIDERQVDPDFILRLFKLYATNGRFDALGNGGVNRRKSISFSTLGKLSIPLPPLHEQRRIAEILSSVDEAIAATRAVIEQTRKVKQGVLERLLTKGIGHTRFKQTEIGEIPEAWEVAPIEAYLARLIDYRGVPPPKAESGVPLITAKNVRMGYLNTEPREYIPADDFDGWMRRGIPQAGDVLFTTEAPLGNVAEVPNYKIALGQRTITLCPDRERLTPSFLKWLLLAPQSQARIAERATGSTALGIKQSTFRKILFGFPQIAEQQRIASYVDGIAAAEEAEKVRLEALLTVKSAMMSDLLTGRKRVTDALPIAAE